MPFAVAERNQARGAHAATAPRVNAAAPGVRAGARRTVGGLRPSRVPAAGEAPRSSRTPTGGRGGVAVQRMRPSRAPAQPSAAAGRPVADALRRAGQPLAGTVRTDMEARLGADLSDVRVHTDSAAHQAAQAVGARAFTAGSHIAFQRSLYDPASTAGRQTLAHELTHVIQQRSGPVTGTDYGGLRVSEPSDRFERAAEGNAHRALSGPARSHEGREGATSVQPGRGAAVVQRYTVENDGSDDVFVSEARVYKVIQGGNTVWVKDGVAVNSVLKKVTKGTDMARFPGYTAYQVGRYVLKDCLHAAEEIINKKPGELKSAYDRGRGGLYSKINVNAVGGGTADEDFGEGYDENVALAQNFAGPQNTLADPQSGEAFVIIATNLVGTMSSYHAAAVVGRDGNDAITLETWAAGNVEDLPAADMYRVGNSPRSFHKRWNKAYFKGSDPITVVISPTSTAANLRTGKRGTKRKENPNVKP